MLVDKTTFFSQSFQVKKRVYEGIAFCSFQPAQLRMKGELRFRLKIAMSLRCLQLLSSIVFPGFSRLCIPWKVKSSRSSSAEYDNACRDFMLS